MKQTGINRFTSPDALDKYDSPSLGAEGWNCL